MLAGRDRGNEAIRRGATSGCDGERSATLRREWIAGGAWLDRSIAAAAARTASAATIATSAGTAPAATVAAPAAATAVFPRLGLVNGQGPALDLLPVDHLASP